MQSSEAEPSNDGSGVGAHQIGHYEVETHKGDKMTPDELHGDFALMYFGTTDHADTVSELERLAEIVGYSGMARSSAASWNAAHATLECSACHLVGDTCQPGGQGWG